MPQSPPADINPDLLEWARKTAGYSLQHAADKLGQLCDRLWAWENGDVQPSIAQVRKAARLYRRPLAIFFLPEVPRDFTVLRDLRRLPADRPRDFSTKLRFLIRSAQERQAWARELLEELGEEELSFIGSAAISERPGDVGSRARELLAITGEERRSWGTRGHALRKWTDALEAGGILVFRSSDVDVQEMRGFALPDPFAPVIVVNTRDVQSAQVFTLIHEYVHLLLGEAGVSNLDFRGRASTPEQQIEVFSNAVTAEILVPADSLSSDWAARPTSDDLDTPVEHLSDFYKVSREVIARRLADLGFISAYEYGRLRARYQQQWQTTETKRTRSSEEIRIKGEIRVLHANGRSFTRLVLGAHNDSRITTRDASDLLNCKLKYLGKLEADIFSQAIG